MEYEIDAIGFAMDYFGTEDAPQARDWRAISEAKRLAREIRSDDEWAASLTGSSLPSAGRLVA